MQRAFNVVTNVVANTFCTSPTENHMPEKLTSTPAEANRTVLGRLQGNARRGGGALRRRAGRGDIIPLKENISWPQPQDTSQNTYPNVPTGAKRPFGQQEGYTSFKQLPAPLNLNISHDHGTSRPRVDSNESFSGLAVGHYQSMGFPSHSPTHTARAQAFYADPSHHNTISPDGEESESLTAFEEYSISDLRPLKYQRTGQTGPAFGSQLTSVVRPSQTYLSPDDTIHIHHNTPVVTALQFIDGLRQRTSSFKTIRAITLITNQPSASSLLHAIADLLSSKHVSSVLRFEVVFDGNAALGSTVEHALLEVLEILSRKHCESLHIEGGSGNSVYDPRNHKTPIFVSELRFPELRSLTLRSPLFVDSGPRVFFLWMTPLLQEHSPLEELALGVPLPRDQAENLACMASAEKLRVLEIDVPQLVVAHLRAWIAELAGLEELVVKGVSLPKTDDPRASFTTMQSQSKPQQSRVGGGDVLGSLRKITAPIAFLDWFFQHSGTCPGLESITIAEEGWEVYVRSPGEWPQVEGTEVRHPLAGVLRIGHVDTRAITVDNEDREVKEDSEEEKEDLEPTNINLSSGTIRLSFPVLTNPAYDTLPMYTPGTHAERTVERLLDIVGTLELRIPPRGLEDGDSLRRFSAWGNRSRWGNGVQLGWLRGFGSVECVVLDRCCSPCGHGEKEAKEDEEDIQSLFRRVRRSVRGWRMGVRVFSLV